MIKEFIEEVKSYIPSLIAGLESLKERPDGSEVLEEIHRLVHTIKGASSMVGLSGLSHIAFQMEEYLEDTISGKQKLTDESFNAMHQTIDLFREYCQKYPNGGVKSRVMLEETVAAFRHTRGLSMDENEQIGSGA
jgi:chemotaxis protein histidine kinase CheA